MAKPDWVKIRNEYETTFTSYRKLAEKHDVSFDTLQRRAKREEWVKSKKETYDKITAKIRQKTVVKIANKESDRNVRHIALLDLILDKAEQVVKDELNTHIDMFGKPHKSPVIKVDALEAAMRIIEKAQKGHRMALGLDKEIERERLDIERQKLELAKEAQEKNSLANVVPVMFSNEDKII